EDGGGGGGGEEGGGGGGRGVEEAGGVGGPGRQGGGGLERAPPLADAVGAGEGNQAHLGMQHKVTQRGALALTADQRRARQRQGGRRGAGRRCGGAARRPCYSAERGPLLRPKGQRRGKQAYGVRVGAASRPPLERADHGHGQPGLLCQRLLGESGALAIAPQLRAEGGAQSLQHGAYSCAPRA